MGYYIQVPEKKNKAGQLVRLYGAQIIPCPVAFEDIPGNKALICVIDNTMFEAAGHCYSQREFEAFCVPDGRPRKWLLMDKELTEKLAQ